MFKCTKCKLRTRNVQHGTLCNVCWSNMVMGEPKDVSKDGQKHDESTKTGITFAVIGGIIGLFAGGPFGAFVGAWLGYIAVVLVVAAQSAFKDQ